MWGVRTSGRALPWWGLAGLRSACSEEKATQREVCGEGLDPPWVWWLGVRPRACGAVTLRDRFAISVLVVRARAGVFCVRFGGNSCARWRRDPFVGRSTLRAGRSKEPVVVVGNLGPGRARGVVVLRVVRVVRRERSW